MRLYCVELLLARNYMFYLYRGQFHRSQQLAWRKADRYKYHCIIEPMPWKNVTTSTVRRRLCEAELYGRIAIKKPLLRKQNNVKWSQWVKANKEWNKVLWIDESKFEILGLNMRVCVRRRVVERAATACITLTVKHGEGFAMVWGAFANCKVGDLHQMKGKLNQTGNHSILQHHTIPPGTRLVDQGFILMQHNDPKHTSKLC